MVKYVKHNVPLIGCVACTLLVAQHVNSAPGALAKEPLFLGSRVPPNILFIVDDSGSMDWEVLTSNGGEAAYPGGNSGNIDLTPTSTDYRELLESCSGYNVMYFDPNKKYTPWVGNDNANQPLADQSVTAARTNPYDSSSYTVNLLSPDVNGDYPGYIPWNDADGDGDFDVGECGDAFVSTGGFTSPSNTVDYSRFIPVTAMSAAQQQNFANWYSYYRKREYVVKRALSEIINDSDARIGLATLHNNNSVGTLVKDVDDKTIPVNATAATNKKTLVDNLLKVDSSGGTPLRMALHRAGLYFTEGQNPGTSLFGFDPGSSSPILPLASGGSCQQNYSVMMTDGTWNSWVYWPYNNDGDGNTQFDGGSYADNYSETLADIAMNYYEGDLHGGLPNNVKIITGVDENPAQHMVTYTVAFGLSGTLDSKQNPADSSFPGWPEPIGNQPTTIDDVWHAAYNGRGEYLNAANPEALITSLGQSIAGIQKREGSASAVAFSSTSLQADTKIFQASFDSTSWFGDLDALKVELNKVGKTAWTNGSAGEQLAKRSSARDIITYNGNKGISFAWPADYKNPTATELSTVQINDLLADRPFANPVNATEETQNVDYVKKLVAYLRGDFTEDGKEFRNRNGKRLGDIVYSSPEFVGVPSELYEDDIESGSSFNDFVEDQLKNSMVKDGVVYVGANDGMLHAFNAATGEEIFAYIPQFIFSDQSLAGLHYLADKIYGYRPYLDGTPTGRSVFVGGKWRTYLVGGARAGGKGIYVLDVTDPKTLTESNADKIVKFEFTHADLGYTFSEPVITKMNNGKWAAVVGNGYNASGDGTAKVFIIYLDGTGYKTLETGVGSIVSSDCLNASSDCNGMATPTTADFDGDGAADRVYAADLRGNLWVFDVRDSSTSNWKPAYGSLSTPEPLFYTGGQPITAKPEIILHPTRADSSTSPNVMVYFGSGQFLAVNDGKSTAVNYFYGVWDNGQIGSLDKSSLVKQVISDPGQKRTVSNNTVDYRLPSDPLYSGNTELGWYEELPRTGERSVTAAQVVNDILFYNTLIPDPSAVCAYGGSGFLMAVDPLTGGDLDIKLFDTNNDGVFEDGEGIELGSIPSESGFISNRQITQTSDGKIDFQVLNTTATDKVERTSLSVNPED